MLDLTLDNYQWNRYEITLSAIGIMMQLCSPTDAILDTRIYREITKMELLVMPGQPIVFRYLL